MKLLQGNRFATLFRMLLLGWSLLLSPYVFAVSVESTGYGQALIFPFYSAAIGNSSLITIANELGAGPSVKPTAVKVRFLGSVDGAELASFNVYLGRYDAWTAAISTIGDEAILESSDASCVLPKAQNGVLARLDENIGSIEVIQMGSVEGFSPLFDAIEFHLCDTFESRWTDGPWNDDPSADLVPPSGGLRGSMILVHVEKGIAYSVPATALTGFSDIVQHTDSGSATPNLSTAHDAGTDTETGTQSTVCFEGKCVSDYWPQPIDAVATALTTLELHGEILTTDSLGAETDWVVSYPTRRYMDFDSIPGETSLVSLFYAGRDGVELLPPCVQSTLRYQCESIYPLSHTEAVEVVSFGHSAEEFDQQAVSAIVGKQITVEFPARYGSSVPQEGTGRLGFEGTVVNVSGRKYLGLPAIGYSLQEVLNSFLNGEAGQTQRANYGMVLPMSRLINIKD